MAHRRPPITPAPSPALTRPQFDEYCNAAQANRLAQSVITQGQEQVL
jgi:hypothetical protein